MSPCEEDRTLRVIAGKLKGRRLAPVRDASIRPTSDRVRESLFSILRDAIPDSRFLDLCAGTGSVGIEAHSRGARDVVFVESRVSVALQENRRRCELTEVTRLLSVPARRALTQLSQCGEEFDIIFMDPPYDSPVLEQSLKFCAETPLLAGDGCIVAEHRLTDPPPQRINSLACVRCETYGDTALSFYVWDD